MKSKYKAYIVYGMRDFRGTVQTKSVTLKCTDKTDAGILFMKVQKNIVHPHYGTPFIFNLYKDGKLEWSYKNTSSKGWI